MTPEAITEVARQIAIEHLEDGIEFSSVYERDELIEVDESVLRDIHDQANDFLNELARSIGA
ncbi:Uncharacterised protein [Mycobacteroides abscessus subsp. abscessus]|uniref:Uncharacterized protein n=1 Tax=Mycobacteroides abscessus subsp. abscessus TaxID=1185650 RepID=A0AB38D1H2_9MYCO|nr:hypothetical protein [Mycobacteroides abscessus]SHX05963.1 Uncharacterised protein [Mycobacteroides abscessus subsp. abscessus]SIA12530.1 Uncharacterised protein [Mycobacteroides abscessus subsp. abscessus]SIB14033.1 Uncharacterised protein [Mycobacteroides abscessus subsp. abscessus]SIB14739.1 Uncharacterised protein [Mycobacteroides abscessus subsp. abscessus]SIB18698.1 Uncharacterised protein [Mycobacteroides abscessus subsp. abscessus]